MAQTRITELIAYSDPKNTDVLPVVDITSDVTKKVDIAAVNKNAALGTDALCGMAFDGDPNTGIYSPGADQLAIATAGTGRLFIDASGRVGIGTTSPIAGYTTTTVGSSAWITNGANFTIEPDAATGANGVDLKTSFSNGGNGPLKIWTAGSERARIDSSGRLLVGTSTVTGDSTFSTAEFVKNTFCEVNVGRFSSSIVSGDGIGRIAFNSYAGGVWQPHASIACVADANSASGDKPGRLEFFTTADGAASPTERFRITNDGVIAHDQPAPAAVNATATLTIENLKAGIITSTSAAATDMTLPTGTNTQAGFSGTYDNFTFEWSVINTGVSLVRVLAGTAHTLVGSGSVATGTSGRFASRRTAANTFVTYRLA